MFTESISMIQPFLFDDFEMTETSPPDAAGKKLVSKINRLRRALAPAEKEFDFYLAVAVREIKSVSSLDREKQIELVLTCLETCCHTWAEIQEDSHLTQGKVREILIELQARDLITARKRYTFGGSAKQTLIYSKRKPCACV